MLGINIKTFKVGDYEALIWIVIFGLFYKISLENYLLFHTVIDSFSAYFAYVIFLIVWKSRNRLENPYFLVIGIAFVFVGSVDFLQALAFKGMEIFRGYNADFSTDLWTISSYVESSAFLVAPLLLMYTKDNGNKNNWIKYLGPFKGVTFAWKVFIAYALITIICLYSIFSLRDFPNTYIEGSGFTPFKIESEYIIYIILLCSLFLLYIQKNIFEQRLFKLFAIAIVLAIFEELSFTLYTQVNQFPNFMGYCFKLLLFYLIYKAIVETGFEGPNSFFFRELKSREEDFRQKAILLGDEYSRICRKIEGNEHPAEDNNKNLEEKQDVENNYFFMQHFPGIKLQFNENFTLKSISGSIEDMTGYRKEDILSGKVNWMEIIVPENLVSIFKKREQLKSNPNIVVENEYRIRRKNGETKWVREIIQKVSDGLETSVKFQGLIYDITERKKAEETLDKKNRFRIREIHHRIKNNLQVISSLLDLQAEKFRGKKEIQDLEVLEAFRESQDRVISMALIHEELYKDEGSKGKEFELLNFSPYVKELAENLFQTYRLGNTNISLDMDLDENLLFNMDIAVPLGMILNELVSNSLKYAFPSRDKGEIQIKLHRKESEDSKSTSFILTVSDNGIGIPENLEIENLDSLGMQLVTTLVDQLDGELELKRNNGTEFTITFTVTENNSINYS